MRNFVALLFAIALFSGCGANASPEVSSGDFIQDGTDLILSEYSNADPLLVEAYLLVPRQEVAMPDYDDVSKPMLASFRDCMLANNDGVMEKSGEPTWQDSVMSSDCAFEAGLDETFNLWVPPTASEIQQEAQQHFLDEVAPCLRLEGFQGDFPVETNEYGEAFDWGTFAAAEGGQEMLNACVGQDDHDHGHGHEH